MHFTRCNIQAMSKNVSPVDVVLSLESRLNLLNLIQVWMCDTVQKTEVFH